MKPTLPKEMSVPPSLSTDHHDVDVKKRHALLLNPFYPKDPHSSFGKHVLTPSLALTSIAASTPENWSIEYWDENLLQGHPPSDPFPEVVGISVHLTFANRAYELADWYRSRGSIVVMGGLHVQSCPDECAPYADALALGEGVQLWREILQDIEQGNLQRRYEGSYKSPYCSDPAPRRDILPHDQFLTTSSVIATRGCHNRCNFCYLSTKGMHMPYQSRDVEQIVEEIENNNSPYAVFIDNNLGSKPEYLDQLCDALMPLNKIWSAAVSIDITDHPKIIRKMALSGCFGVFVGFESLNDQSIINSKKRSPMPEDYARRVKLFHDNGIQVNGSFVFGFDHDQPDVFERTVDWIEENRLESATFHILTPYPSTPLFKQYEEEGRLLHKDWSRYDTSHVVYKPRGMSKKELQEGYEYAYRRLFSYKSIWKRRPMQATAVLPYLAMSQLYKQSNWLWRFLIKHRLTHAVWKPLIELTRWRHLKFRRKLKMSMSNRIASSIVSAGV